jgi:hypothetical protein
MKDRDAMTALYLYRYHGWSLAEAGLFFSPADRSIPILTDADVGRAWGLTGARSRPYDKAVADLARRIAGGYVPSYGSA